VAQSLSILSHFHQGKDEPRVRNVVAETMDQKKPWAYFDGASQNDGQIYGGGAILYMSESHYYNLTMGLGPVTNSYVELMALKLLLTFTREKGINSLQIFGDSMVVINWIRKSQVCHNIRLSPLLGEVFITLVSSKHFSIHHVYRERNWTADNLSKEGLRLDLGQWKVAEFGEETAREFYRRPFIDPVDQEGPVPHS